MTSGTTRKFRDDDQSKSPKTTRTTRPRHEIEYNEYNVPLSAPSPNPRLEIKYNISLSTPSPSSRLEIEYDFPSPSSSPPPPLPLHANHCQPDLNLSLGPSSLSPAEPQPVSPVTAYLFPSQPLPIQPTVYTRPQPQPVVAPAPRRLRKNPTHAPRQGKSTTIQPPFEWATDRRAQVHTLTFLKNKGVTIVSGNVQCKRCERQYEIKYDLEEKFTELARYIAENKYGMRERAPAVWMNPALPRCDYCRQENSVKPKMAEKKKSINWLFLLLGQMLGCCTLEQLKYFCKHTGNHRTGAKDRILFLTYLGLCKQVDPSGPFDRD